MATQYICDRCLRITTSTSSIKSIEIPRTNYEVGTRQYDLCDECLRALSRFLEPLPQVAKS